MKIIGIAQSGKQIEFTELNFIDGECDVILAKLNIKFKSEEIEEIEKELSEKIGKKVVCIPSYVGEILSVK